MEQFLNYIQNFHWESYLKIVLIFLLGTIFLHILGKLFFKKRSLINHAISATFCIMFIYAAAIFLQTILHTASHYIVLPLITFHHNRVDFISLTKGGFFQICSSVLQLITLAFCVNLADSLLPKGKHLLMWFLVRCISVVGGYLAYAICAKLLSIYLPNAISLYAPAVLLGILFALLFTGFLRIPAGALLSTINPIIGALYTFFAANIIGRQITKAIISSSILCGLMLILQYWGVTGIDLDYMLWLPYFPATGVAVALWYVAYKIL